MLNVQKTKQDFPIFKRIINGHPLVYLDNAATTQKPQVVLDSISDFYQNHNANIHRGVHTLSEEATNLYDEARQNIADFLDARFEEIIFTRNTTESLNLVAHTLSEKLKNGDEILLSLEEHHSNLVPWQIIARKTGAKLVFIPLTQEGELDFSLNLLNKNTKILSLPHISNVLGTINPVKSIFKKAKKFNQNIICILDAAQSVPHMPVSVRDLNCDFLAFSGHKICGPTGIGVLFGKKDLLESLPPFLGGGDMIETVCLDSATYNVLPFKFEAGTSNIAGVIGLSAAVTYVRNIGMDNIQNHEKDIISYALEKLLEFPEITILGPKDPQKRSGLISFTFQNIHPHDIAQVFDSFGVAVRSGQHCTMPLHDLLKIPASTRISTYFYNDKSDIDKAIEALKKTKDIFKI